MSLIELTCGERLVRDNFFIYFLTFPCYAALAIGIFVEFSIFSINMPYPSVAPRVVELALHSVDALRDCGEQEKLADFAGARNLVML